MALRVRCPGCKSSMSCGEDVVGKRLRCGHCHKVFAIRGVLPPAKARSKPTNVWMLLGVGVLTAGILFGSIWVAIDWYETPSGPPTPTNAKIATPPPAGPPQGYDRIARDGR